MRSIGKNNLILSILILLLMAIAGGFMLILIYVYNDDYSDIHGLTAVQNEYKIEISWEPKENADKYEVTTYRGFSVPQTVATTDTNFVLDNINLDDEYKVVVLAKDASGEGFAVADTSIKTEKFTQTLKLSQTEIDGFAGDRVDIKATAEGTLSYKAEDSATAMVSETGTVSFKESGVTTITVTASETDTYKPATQEIKVKVYPNTLDTPELKLVGVEDGAASFDWTKDKFATQYQLLRKNPATGQYNVVKTLNDEKTSTTVGAAQGEYALRTVVRANKKKIESEPSSPVTVEALANSAEHYSKAKTLASLTRDDLDVIAKIHGTGSEKVPQSMSYNGKEYIISYVNHSGSSGKFVAYDAKTGEKKSINKATGMGHANGATCNMNTGKIYVAKTHKNYKTSKSNVYSAADYTGLGEFNLPKVTSGIAYDPTNDKFYLSKGNNVYVTDSEFNVERSIYKRARYNHAQDIGGYNGVAFVCTWVSGKTSYIDMYRTSDGTYLGSYDVSIGEIESCLVNDGYLIILMNIKGTNDAYIYKTKERISF